MAIFAAGEEQIPATQRITPRAPALPVWSSGLRYAGNLSDKLSVALVQKLSPATINPLEAWAAMRQIADWLEKLGMPAYAERFAENAIDFSVLPISQIKI
jgi:hypothetical protein